MTVVNKQESFNRLDLSENNLTTKLDRLEKNLIRKLDNHLKWIVGIMISLFSLAFIINKL